MSERVVTVEKSGPIGYMVLNRPPANSYNLEFMEDLNAAIEEVRRDDEIKVVITRSALDRFFSAGATKAIGLIKLAVNEGLEVSLDSGMVIERQGINQLFASEDAQEGFQAFLEKRKPQFKGR